MSDGMEGNIAANKIILLHDEEENPKQIVDEGLTHC